ncbi:MAG: undecaprenyldiphospho-muramoylpentapeptide beta-N-acetylglucosaminyltransferase [Candidatus Dadabacteria bacterium]|nr:undecaprenyldiphospho-muramoylpentapeptide beta-N-acetylglucosaminyltransferase [Candidatus Dadabacteria bacterium]
MRIIIAGGGTGGHVFPAVSIAEEITDRNHEDEILFVGTEKGLENELLLKKGYKIKHISSRGFVGRGLFKTLIAFLYAFKGLFDSISIIRSFKPDVVLGVGGYVSGPLVLIAVLLRIPTAICEQNTVPGVTNRILGRIVNKIFASFDSSVLYFPSKKVVITGNPIRKEILNKTHSPENFESISVLIFGGSQGAYSLNRSVPEAFSKIDNMDISIIHQTGEKDYLYVKDLYMENEINAQVLTFIDDMAEAYSKSNLVIGRAGAGTIAEITALGKPSILVPFPYAAHNHQFENAKILESSDATVLIEDKDATPEKFALTLTNLFDEDKLNIMAANAKKLGKPEAAREIVDDLYNLAGDN